MGKGGILAMEAIEELNEISLCSEKHCLCKAMSTTDEPPETGKRIRAYWPNGGWEFITWHNGDQTIYTHWRYDLAECPCEKARRLKKNRQKTYKKPECLALNQEIKA